MPLHGPSHGCNLLNLAGKRCRPSSHQELSGLSSGNCERINILDIPLRNSIHSPPIHEWINQGSITISTWRDHDFDRPAHAYGKHKLKPGTRNLSLCIAVPCLRRTPQIGKVRTAGTGRSRQRSNDLNDLRRMLKSK